ncbi:hypothetical protein QE152_g1216 [Popillia japonica]|uniref:Uncharacterized protein n=1 Tax=Popillia japonica TaxID=7064 RepID=A0AAW1NB21_POPJA
MGILSFILSNKLMLLFCFTTVGFCIATIVLAVDNSNLRNELEDLKAETTTTAPEEMTDYRLPTNIIPTKYDLYLYPDLTTGTGNFTGTVEIAVSVSETTEIVKLHSNSLTIKTLAQWKLLYLCQKQLKS